MLYLLVALAVVFAGLWRLTHPPRGFAPGLPVIPLWVALLPLARSRLGLPLPGQDETYAKYIEPAMRKHGAVVIFFGQRWNVLVAHPAAMKQLFAKEKEVYQKSGNHKKIPHAVISRLTGGNVISETGDVWRRYAEVVRPALKAQVDFDALKTSCARLVQQLRNTAGAPMGITALAQRYSMESVCLAVLGRDLQFLSDPAPQIHAVHALVKKHIFHPLFLSFPALDSFPRLFPSRVVAGTMIDKIEDELLTVLPSQAAKRALGRAERTEKEAATPPGEAEKGGDLDSYNVLRSLDEALIAGKWTRREYIDNLKILFIAGHENAQQALCSLLLVLARDPELQQSIRAESLSLADDPTPGPLLHATLHETLRLLPPIPQLFNRCVATPTVLSLPSLDGSTTLDVPLRTGTYVGWTAFGLHRSTYAPTWSPDPEAFRPTRWGATVEDIDSLARKARSSGEFVTFHGGARACPGQPIAMRSLHMCTRALLEAFEISVGSEVGSELTPGGLLAPRNAQLRFVARE